MSCLLPSKSWKVKRLLLKSLGFLSATHHLSALVANVMEKKFLPTSLKMAGLLRCQIFPMLPPIISLLIVCSKKILPRKLHFSFNRSSSGNMSSAMILTCSYSESLSFPHYAFKDLIPSIFSPIYYQ